MVGSRGPVRTVLLTAFEPFDGAATNPSMAVVERVASAWDRPERLRCAVLPVAYTRAQQELESLLTQAVPDVVVGVGLAGGRARPGVERLAVNLRDARIADNDGAQPVDEPVIDGGPLALLTSLPVRATVARLRAAGQDVELSMTAGTFVCNAVFYTAATWAGADPGRRAGFVHVPAHGVDDSAHVVRAVIEDALDLERDLAVPTGATA
ncbi:pyroglutamyl-peptidase I [Pseudactinotalea suaedae]|uniref:pyroglutamyl-peptidase I family protein n=1 Tax=Pseudactinotalea suaedae TaxID=1524924 RepID=UPI0012E1C7A0|nr:pyroglutamyl-peptidase I [Pseudactinotalea suaedae]